MVGNRSEYTGWWSLPLIIRKTSVWTGSPAGTRESVGEMKLDLNAGVFGCQTVRCWTASALMMRLLGRERDPIVGYKPFAQRVERAVQSDVGRDHPRMHSVQQ